MMDNVDANTKTIVEMHTDLKWIKTKMSEICCQNRNDHDCLFDKHNALESRIDKMESWKDKVNTAFYGIYILFGLLWSKFMKFF